MMMRHVNTRIATLLSLSHSQLADMFEGPTADVIKELEERKAAGEIFLPCDGCNGFDPVKGCPGHEIESIIAYSPNGVTQKWCSASPDIIQQIQTKGETNGL